MARFDCATWRPISVNLGGRLSANLGLVLHHQAGNGSLHSFFNRPASRVSAHFWVGKQGQIEQYADTSRVTWHGRALNSRYVSVETEGCPLNPGGQTARDEPLTGPQLAALGRLYAEGARRHGWPNAMANANGQRGLGFHRMAVATACPCQLRLGARPEILRRAFHTAPGPSPQPPPPPAPGTPRLRVDFMGRLHNRTAPDVRVWQQRMAQRGWRIGVDQVFGPQSEQVARAFQAEKRLRVDGLVGPVTWTAAWTAPVT